jgi:ubiquinone/menaquinone biosynthesis C-methylase UbiE
MSRKRRHIGIDEASSWIFNRMADVYDARPPYPEEMIDALVDLATPVGRRVLDLGTGLGYLAFPLAERGLHVTAIEPALAMLERMRRLVVARGVEIHTLHAAAESLPFEACSFDVVLIADALHFMDAQLVAAQLRRVLVSRGVLAIVTCEFADTAFMRSVRALLSEASDRRPREVEQAIRHVSSLSQVDLSVERRFHSETAIDPLTLERILQSVSFIGPAMNEARFSALRERLHSIPHEPVWALTFSLRAGRRRRSRFGN